jgi:mono-ADP-ribosyltransferase sirtuin 6
LVRANAVEKGTFSTGKAQKGYTGAGISTSSGIPDFRGPNGVWTRERNGFISDKNETNSFSFHNAKPSLCHRALVELLKCNKLKHVISQNVDGLHLRSGIHPENLTELHGNIFMEKCEKCFRDYFRDYDVGGMGLQPTGNLCDIESCKGVLRDWTIDDWDTELPKDKFKKATSEINKADLIICLGTSLRIRPAGNMPSHILKITKNRKNKGLIVIVNLQKTHLDKKAANKINFQCDSVMKILYEKINVNITDCKSKIVESSANHNVSGMKRLRAMTSTPCSQSDTSGEIKSRRK